MVKGDLQTEAETRQMVCEVGSRGQQRDSTQTLLLNVMTVFPAHAIEERELSQKK